MTRERSPRHRGIAAAVLALTLSLGSFAAFTPSVPAAPPARTARTCGTITATTSAILNLTNATRTAYRVGRLRWNSQLACLAKSWSNYMALKGVLVHRNLSATIRLAAYRSYRTLGENILRGPTSMLPSAMHNAWMASPGHKANIIAGKYTSLGVGVTFGRGSVWVTENFGG